MIYTTKENERLDAICFKYYNRCDAVAKVIEANSHLNNLGAVLPANVKINLIDIAEPVKSETTINLWD
ncbi:tail protein X [Lentisphaerota bacterium WC36G]|nr:tail protein X [Lentisphaerae bacterium WC36]